jgi:MoCo/4Fe-4S cofactor protein with predicted Tat translocation signal
MDIKQDSTFTPLPILDAETGKPRVDIAAIRDKLANARGRDYWRSLEELAETPEFQDFVQHEFPRDVDVWDEPISRRTFLKLMGASLGLAFFSGCRKPLEMILPYNQQPEDIIPGKPLYFASAIPFQGYARGVLVESQMGRPTKIEGNPQHPDSLGATDVFTQAAVLSLYDPDRSQVVSHNGLIQTWEDFFAALRSEMAAQRPKQGAGLRILTETVTSPFLAAQIADVLKAFPKARWHQYEPITRDGVREGARLAFGDVYETRYRLEKADVILSLDADFLMHTPGSLAYARAFAARRQAGPGKTMNRLYVAEPTLTITGTMADHRLPLKASAMETFTRALANELGLSIPAGKAALSVQARRWAAAVARDLRRHRGSCVVMAGDAQPAAVHALAHAINHTLGNSGHTVLYTEPAEARPVDQLASLQDLVKDMQSDAVDVLLILGGNPVYNAPADIAFGEALSKVPMRAHLSTFDDETTARCPWQLPEAHVLESWGDLRAFDGTVSLIQPLIEPLYAGKTAAEILSAVIDGTPRRGYDLLHDYWKTRSRTLDFEKAWRKSLNDGVVAGTALPTRSPALQALRLPTINVENGLEVVFKPDPSVWDGRFANNGWLQELPRPMTKLTWDNAALIGPALAERLHLAQDDVIELRAGRHSLQVPVFILPGQADETITLTLGYGRTRVGRVGNGVGVNAYALRTAGALSYLGGVSLQGAGRRHALVTTQHHYSLDGRDLVRTGSLDEFNKDPRFAQKEKDRPKPEETLYTYSPPKKSDQNAWAMAIDLNLCIGCNACIIACQAENNIPVVGKDQVARGREMHWLRVDRYYQGDLDNPTSCNQPVPCMHCEDAPCEVVCPVGATSHSDEGLNQMVYNRCVGTRYCSNNCPYKVRRFNFYDYTKSMEQEPLKLLQNPDVTVRSRGVMEKCTYCVQRIQSAKITADKAGRAVMDGEIVPACAQACPTQTIIFGNLLDKKSAVSVKKSDPRDYAMLGELGVRPRTTYQARLRNINPDLGES